MNRLALPFAAVFFISSCSDLGLGQPEEVALSYPRCFLFRSPKPADIEAIMSSDTAFVQSLLGDAQFVSNKDQLIILATASTHRQIRPAWPQYACVNLRRSPPFNAEINDKWVVSRCQEYIAEVISQPSGNSIAEISAKFDEFSCH